MDETPGPPPDMRTDRVEVAERSRVAAQEVSWSLRAVHRAASAVDEALAHRVGLRHLDYAALSHVMAAEGTPVGPAELGQRLGISTGSASELVDRLERAGHVTRSRVDNDRRRVSVVPRRTAVERVLGHLAPVFAALDDLSDQFSPAEQDVINRYLRRAADELTEHAEALSRRPPD